jgi:DNA-binding SARP family transcriptional activator/class 3 adenylate cyclase
MKSRWHVELLGQFQARSGDRLLSRFRTQKTGLLLGYLAFHAPRAERRDLLVELFWPESDLERGRRCLRVELTWLRHHLEGAEVAPGTVLIADRASVGLNVEVVSTDVGEFQDALRRAARGAKSGVRGEPQWDPQWLRRAVECYRGELLPGYGDEWVVRERARLAERYFEALGHLLRHLEGVGEFDRAVEYARQGVSADPLREETHRDLMRLLAASGQPQAGLRQYAELERLLREEMGAEPEAATCALAREIERVALLRATRDSRGITPSGATWLKSRSEGGPPAEEQVRLVSLLSVAIDRATAGAGSPVGEEDLREHRLLPAMVDAVLRNGGRIDRIEEDGMLAVFGVPQSHEEDPERAVRAALAIRSVACHLGLGIRAGVHTGSVNVTSADLARQPEETKGAPALRRGAAVERTERLRQMAQPGQILVGSVTRRLTRRAFVFASVPVDDLTPSRSATIFSVVEALPRPQKPYGVRGAAGGSDRSRRGAGQAPGRSERGRRRAGPDGLADRRGRDREIAAGGGAEGDVNLSP